MSVIPFQKKEKHVEGPAICLDCKHEWEAVIPQDSIESALDWLECPNCHLHKGRFKYKFTAGPDIWICACGNDLFQITSECVYCPNCGQEQVFPKR